MFPQSQSYRAEPSDGVPESLPRSVPDFWEECRDRYEFVSLPSAERVARLTAYERATARILHFDRVTPPPPSQVGEALTRLRLWERDRGLRFHSVNRLAKHLQHSMGTRHPAGYRLAKYGWSLLAALDAADLVHIELTAEDTRERVRLALRLAELDLTKHRP